MSRLITDINCHWCGKEDMCVSLESQETKFEIMVCIPCLNEVRHDWLEEEAENKNKLTRIK